MGIDSWGLMGITRPICLRKGPALRPPPSALTFLLPIISLNPRETSPLFDDASKKVNEMFEEIKVVPPLVLAGNIAVSGEIDKFRLARRRIESSSSRY